MNIEFNKIKTILSALVFSLCLITNILIENSAGLLNSQTAADQLNDSAYSSFVNSTWNLAVSNSSILFLMIFIFAMIIIWTPIFNKKSN